MLRILIKITIIILIVGCNRTASSYSDQSKKNETQEELLVKKDLPMIDSLSNIYGLDRICVVLFFYNNALFPEFEQNNDVNYCSLGTDLTTHIKSADLESLDESIAIKEVGFITKWFLIEDRILSITPMESDTDISVFEIVYKMKNGKQYFDDFLTNSSQYYNSLSFSQECHLFYNIIFELTQSDQHKIDLFFDEYITIYNQLNKNKEVVGVIHNINNSYAKE